VEGKTEGMSFYELEKEVEEKSEELWGGQQSQLIKHTFPFKPLSNDDLEAIVRYQLKKLPQSPRFKAICQIELTTEAGNHIVTQLRRRHPHENGRGVKKWIEKYLFPILHRSVPAKGTVFLRIFLQNNQLELSSRRCDQKKEL